ncbi:GrdX family protein [Crassaminicella indica]|uniref:GrdX family protein n=1 Tax=Crassaminicella indica TaxID=2855394 RepID=A0ABX8RFF7_9CLOT|nr:GrdX family protein [Crassaminicella indica]QXM05676.1 GrdX family protein [Crassaminicella indica]
MKKVLITNNLKVFEENKEKMDIIYSKDYTYLDVLIITRNKIHEGYRLLTHPLSGSVKPNETPFKSVIMTKKKNELHIKSLEIIEESIQTAEKFIKGKKIPLWTEKILEDFKLIDYCLIKSAIESMDQFF